MARNLDWKRTIQRNLRGWDAERRRLVPERFYFWANQKRRHEWDVAILVDQSGSMGESVVYSSIMAAIFASLDVLRTRLLFFDTEVVDVTPMLVDPVDVLFDGAARRRHRHQPRGGLRPGALHRAAREDAVDPDHRPVRGRQRRGARRAHAPARGQQGEGGLPSGAAPTAGKPSYDHQIGAEARATWGPPRFGCTPKLLPGVIERVMKGQDLAPLLAEAETEKR